MGKMFQQEDEQKGKNVGISQHKSQGNVNSQNEHMNVNNQQQPTIINEFHPNSIPIPIYNPFPIPISHPTHQTIYLTSQPSPTFLSTSIQEFNLYKRLVQNTIIELGEDWRIQSGLLAQEIINQKNLTNDQFCIFNEFMAGFLRAKIIQQQQQLSRNNLVKQKQTIMNRQKLLPNYNLNNVHNKRQQQQKQRTSQSRQQQQQYEFLKYFCRTLPYNNNTQTILTSSINKSHNNGLSFNNQSSNNHLNTNSNKIEIQADFSNNLTFKTLSLGFYITAGDIWMRMFSKYHKVEVEEGIKRIQINNESNIKQQGQINNNKKLVYFASLCEMQQNTNNNNNNSNTNKHINPTPTTKWLIHPQQQIYSLLTPYQSLLMNENKNSSQNLRKSIKLGSVIVNIQQTVIKLANTDNKDNNNSDNNNSDTKNNNIDNSENKITIRKISISNQFYSQLFLVWLVFSIKKSFNSTLFPIQCFIRYCDIIISSRIFESNQKQFVLFHSVYRQFKLLCDSQWKKLMKDYMMALNDDKQVLRVLVKRIQEQLIDRYQREMQGKKDQILKMKMIGSNNNNRN